MCKGNHNIQLRKTIIVILRLLNNDESFLSRSANNISHRYISSLSLCNVSFFSYFCGVELLLEKCNVPCENASTPVPMLYQSGYLTIDYYNKEDDVYVLHFPNYEVRQGMVYSLTNYLMDISDWDRNATILAMARALKRGDLPSALTELRSYIASLPYDIITRKEWMAKKKKM